jgi:four helix bundle protein
MSGFKDLRVWQDAMDLVVRVYKMSGQLPNNEIHGLTSQIKRSAVSVPSNIAEGWGRRRDGEFYRFLDIAYGSLCELETQLELVERCYFLNVTELKTDCETIQKQVGALRKTVGQSK